ncbi:hypothetical protein DV736_g143, partial [Chaetothyriales sp. CBS 134916]
MAPNRKKKKPAANAARGFATTSVASKANLAVSQDQDVSSTANTPPDSSEDRQGWSSPAAGAAPNPSEQPSAIESMTPEQLEAHLEDSELQLLLDMHSSACKSDAARQVSRLYTERRQLRLQAYRLNLHPCFPDETVEEILSIPVHTSAPAASASRTPAGLTESKLLLDVWVLQRVLTALDFCHIPEVISQVVKLAHRGRIASDTGLVWGLAEAFDAYTQCAPPQLLPDYDDDGKVVTAKDKTIALRIKGEEMLSNPPFPANQQVDKDDSPAPTTPQETTDQGPGDRVSSDSEISTEVDEDDTDPNVLTARYLRIKTKLWKRQQHRGGGAESLSDDRKTRKLQDKATLLERDPLFDQEAASMQWKILVTDLRAEEGRRCKATRMVKRTEDMDPNNEGTPNQPSESADDPDLFGDMFTAPGEDLQDSHEADQGKSVRLVDFGKSSGGLSPRQLLEDSCKAIDARATVKVVSLTETTYSARHKITIAWSATRQTEDRSSVEALPAEVTAAIHPSQWSIAMESIAASATEQSVGYVSMLMLFLVYSRRGPEQQSSILRLPNLWRKEFNKLVDRRKELVNESDKSELRELRRLIRAEETITATQGDPDAKLQNGGVAARIGHRRQRDEVILNTPKVVLSNWTARTARSVYQKMAKVRQQLPIYEHKDTILDAIAAHPVTIVCAETGSGKSTQTASYILEREHSKGRDCRILVTEPRRISAVSLARRVSVELGEDKNDLGTLRSLVGYAIKLESKTSPSTRLTFATTGVLLRMLESSPDLDQLDYLILDEVHERTIEMDLLFIVLQRLQQKQSTALKIILMSATVDATKFSEYFGTAPILDIPGRAFLVETYFLEDAIENTNDVAASTTSTADFAQEDGLAAEENSIELYGSSPAAVGDLTGYSARTRQRLAAMDEYRIDYDLVIRLASAIAVKPKYKRYSSAILIFMPGFAEIRRLHNALLSTGCFENGWDIHMLHSSFSTEELERAFVVPSGGRRKIVIATNIAETGITIPDVTAVIDTCKEKIMRFDERRQLSRLTEGFVSRSSAKQRRGRAARVQEGLCFHLVTRHRHDHRMLEQQVPEMMRLSLQDPILRVKIWKMCSIEETFQAAIDPPSRKNVLRAVERLKDAGALTKTEQLTALGQRIARLPLDVSLAKLAILGAICRCLEPVLTIIAMLTSKDIYLRSSGVDHRTAFARSDSDLLSSLAAYEGWRKARAASQSGEFCRRFRLSEQNLGQVEEQKFQLLVYLVEGEIVSLDAEERIELNKARLINNGGKMRRKELYQMPPKLDVKVADDLLLALVALAFYPRILTREGKGWRNVYTNQQVSLRRESVNNGIAKPPRWLSFSEAMQSKNGNLNVFETSRIPDVALALLLGEAEIKVFAGVLVLDNGRIKLSVRNWKQTVALKHARSGIREILERQYRKLDHPRSNEIDDCWIEQLRIMMMMSTGAPSG